MVSEAELVKPSRLGGADWLIAFGLFLVVASSYGLTASGRMDTIDGQYRFEVTRSLLDGAGFQIRDPKLLATVGVDGKRYGDYGPMASLLALPLCWVGRLLGGDVNMEMFLFSFTSGWVASVAVAVFYCFRRRMGATPGAGIFWSLALAWTTPLWPLAVSVFHQAQQATCMLLGMYLAWESALRRRLFLGFLAGVMSGALGLFNLGGFVLVPPVGLAVLDNMAIRGRPMRAVAFEAARRYGVFALGVLIPFVFELSFNYVRYGNPLMEGGASQPNHPPIWGNPLKGLVGLLFSPGKSIFLFFPTVVLFGIFLPRTFRKLPALAWTILGTLIAAFGLAASLSMWPSDWAWGPRYVMFLAPIFSLTFGVAGDVRSTKKWWIGVLLTAGLCSQLLGISVEHWRFFLEQRVDGYFWYYDPGFYYRESQFFARVGEVWSLISEGVPPSARVFSGIVAEGGPPTYPVTRAGPDIAHIWMRNHAVFYLPRPWPFWVPTLPRELQPVNVLSAVSVLLMGGVVGVILLHSGLRRAGRQVVPDGDRTHPTERASEEK